MRKVPEHKTIRITITRGHEIAQRNSWMTAIGSREKRVQHAMITHLILRLSKFPCQKPGIFDFVFIQIRDEPFVIPIHPENMLMRVNDS